MKVCNVTSSPSPTPTHTLSLTDRVRDTADRYRRNKCQQRRSRHKEIPGRKVQIQESTNIFQEGDKGQKEKEVEEGGGRKGEFWEAAK